MNVVKSLVSVVIIFFREPNSTIEQQKCEDHKKSDRLLVLKVDFNFQISQRNKKFTY